MQFLIYFAREGGCMKYANMKVKYGGTHTLIQFSPYWTEGYKWRYTCPIITRFFLGIESIVSLYKYLPIWVFHKVPGLERCTLWKCAKHILINAYLAAFVGMWLCDHGV